MFGRQSGLRRGVEVAVPAQHVDLRQVVEGVAARKCVRGDGRLFSRVGKPLPSYRFYAYDPAFLGGAYVAVGRQ